jgi:hypothetical protein
VSTIVRTGWSTATSFTSFGGGALGCIHCGERKVDHSISTLRCPLFGPPPVRPSPSKDDLAAVYRLRGMSANDNVIPVLSSDGRKYYNVEHRIASRRSKYVDVGKEYLWCPCPGWGGQFNKNGYGCRHVLEAADILAQRQAQGQATTKERIVAEDVKAVSAGLRSISGLTEQWLAETQPTQPTQADREAAAKLKGAVPCDDCGWCGGINGGHNQEVEH